MTTTTRRPSAKRKPPAKTSTARNNAARNNTAKNNTAKKKTVNKKAAVKKKTVNKKTVKKKATAKKAATKRAVSKKAAPKRAVAKSAVSSRAESKKPAARKAPTKRTVAKKTPAKRAPVKRTAAKKAPVRRPATSSPKAPVARKTPVKRVAAGKAPASRTVPARRTPTAKRATSRAQSRKAPAKRQAARRPGTIDLRSAPTRARAFVSEVDARRPPPVRKQYAAPVVAPIAMPRKPVAPTAQGERLAAMLMLLFLALTLFGLVMVLSASSVSSLYATDGSPFDIFRRQAVWAGIGGVAFVIFARIDYRWVQTITTPLLATSLGLLVAVLVPGMGSNLNGSSRWLDLGPIVIQPAELAKLSLIVFCADLLTRRRKHILEWKLTMAPVLIVVALFSGLLLLQPKLGTPIVMATIALLMLFIAGTKISSLSIAASLGILAATFFTFSADYRYRRITAFLDPWADPLGFGRQIIQSQVGIASGGLLGVGLGASKAKWGFLPYASSDFIFTVVAEEIGLIGAALLISAFLMIGYLGMQAAVRAPEPFGMLLAAGITCWLLVQAFLNIGMAMGQLPITGEPLPFVSAGGSSLVTTLAAAGLLTNVARRGRAPKTV